MNLEDHLGDILRKARQAASISLATAAQAAGIDQDALAQLEDSGCPPANFNFRGIGELLALSAPKLEGIARGWTPALPDLSQWRELRQISSSDGALSVHCYLVWDEVTRQAALFDTGFDAEAILNLIDANQLQLRHLFITHTHRDHIAAISEIRAKFPKLKLHSNAKSAPPDQRNRSNDFIHLGSLRITNRETPGHAEDGVTYVIGTFPDDAPNIAVVGDAIFAGSIGGVKADAENAKKKIRDQILSLPPPTLICPGHGPLTTVSQEREHNPFF